MEKSNTKAKVLFVCVHNSARSQMAEAWLTYLCGDFYDVQSAGLEPGVLNPLVVEAMQEVGVDISQKKTQSVVDLLNKGLSFDYVIAVCDGASAGRCPVFPGEAERIQWDFPDPSQLVGTKAEKLEKIRSIRDSIKARISRWCSSVPLKGCQSV